MKDAGRRRPHPRAARPALTAALAGLVASGCMQSGGDATLVERFQAELDAAWEQAQDTGENFPGATAAFILPDGRVFGFATGLSDIDDGIPMTKDLRMPSGSIGRPTSRRWRCNLKKTASWTWTNPCPLGWGTRTGSRACPITPTSPCGTF